MPKIVLNLDSSQITAFLQCPREWHYNYEMRLSSISGPPSEALVMGTYGHRLLDIFYKSIAEGKDRAQALEIALAFKPEDETVCLYCKQLLTKHFGKDDELKYYCDTTETQEYEPTPFPLSEDTRQLVRKRIREYSFTYHNNDIVPKSPKHVEVGFTHKLYEDDEFLFTLEGRIDLLGTLAGQDCIVDHKFQLRRNDLYSRSIQFKNYALVTGVNMFVVNYIRLTKTVNTETYARQPTMFSKQELEQWERYLIAIFMKIARYKQKEEEIGKNFYLLSASDPNWANCSGRYGYPCQFSPICEEPQLADSKIKHLYHIKEEWKPW